VKHWIVIPCVTPHSGGEVFHDAVATVEADTAEEAGEIAHDLLLRENPDLDPDYTGSMFALSFEPAEFVALQRGVRFTKAADEWQCCGGPIELTDNGHSGFCPHRAKDPEQ
jgi:hypothetical protein